MHILKEILKDIAIVLGVVVGVGLLLCGGLMALLAWGFGKEGGR